MVKYYLHTIKGEPAGWGGEQIIYAEKRCWKAPLVKDLKTIRKQQKQTFKFRKQFGEEYDPKIQDKYDYVVVEVEE